MLLCSFDPGLLILKGLEPHENSKSNAVLRSLIVHKRMMDQAQVEIPMTKKYIEHIYANLENIPISPLFLQSQLRDKIIAVLTKMSSPLLPPAELADTTLEPGFTSEWIDEETRNIWLDSLTVAMFEEYTNNNVVISSATWSRENNPHLIRATNPKLCEQLEVEEYLWNIPVLVDELDWNEIFCSQEGWPAGLETTLIDNHAKKHLGISLEDLSKRRSIEFKPSCYKDICREEDPNIRSLIIEVMACRAFNCLRSDHHDETVKNKPGVRRVYVKKMEPDVRLHYVMDDETLTFIQYANRDHNRGL